MKMEARLIKVRGDLYEELERIAEELAEEWGIKKLSKDDTIRHLVKLYRTRRGSGKNTSIV